MQLKYKGSVISSTGFVIVFILQTLFKIAVGVVAYFLVKKLFSNWEVKDLIFFYIAWCIAWKSQLVFQGLK